MSQPDAAEDVVGREEPSGGQVVGQQSGPDKASLDAAGADISDLEIAWNAGNKYHVWSERELQMSYFVDLSGQIPTCNCEHGRHNRDSNESCRHIKKAITILPAIPQLQENAFNDLVNVLTDVYDLRDGLRRQLTGHEADAAVEGGTDPSPSLDGVDRQAERLAEAFEEAGISHEMEWTSDTTSDGKGRIWFAFDGKVPSALFSAFIQDPDQVWYQPDDSPDSDKPNSIMVENVDGYISGVLE